MFEGNPFPGLRPFEFDENYLFFGREEQVAQLLQRLGNTRFLAVVGASGYSGEELVWLLLGHPRVELTAVTSRQYSGK